jgi:hypothetical protein
MIIYKGREQENAMINQVILKNLLQVLVNVHFNRTQIAGVHIAVNKYKF